MTNEMTKTQERILVFIQSRIQQQNMPPTYDEIAEHFSFHSKNAARDHVQALIRKGFLTHLPGKSRGLVPVKQAQNRTPLNTSSGNKPRGIPLVGTIAAGSPILATENIEDYIDFTSFFVSNSPVFALTVKGDSMLKAGIMNGDKVVIKRQPRVDDGEIAAVLVGEEATVKRVYRKRNGLLLRPENDKYRETLLDPNSSDFLILGKVVGVIRKVR
jgi:repressor LexA